MSDKIGANKGFGRKEKISGGPKVEGFRNAKIM